MLTLMIRVLATLLLSYRAFAVELPDIPATNIDNEIIREPNLNQPLTDVVTDYLPSINNGGSLDSDLTDAIQVDYTGVSLNVRMEELTSKVFDASLIAQSLIDMPNDSAHYDNRPDEFVDLLTPQGQLAEGAFQDQLMSPSMPVAAPLSGSDAVPCRVFLGDDLKVSFNEVSSHTVSREVSVLVQCDKGVNYRLSATNGVEEKARFIAALESEDGRQPAMIDIRHPSGHTLSTNRYVGSGEPQSLPIQLTLFSASRQALLGHVRSVEDIRLELDIVR